MEMQKQQADGRIFEAKPTERRYDFVLFFEVREANPNGDPDAGNLPRTDPLTQEGLVTDVSIKRKWRDYVFEAKKKCREAWKPHLDNSEPSEPGYDIFVRHNGILANQQRQAIADSQGVDFGSANPIKKDAKDRDQQIESARKAACRRFIDVRTFGAVMTTGKVESKKANPTPAANAATGGEKAEWNCGQVKGPVQLTFARSVHKINPVQWSIARVAQTNPGDNQNAEEGESEHGTFGQKPTIGYALYRAHGFVSASLAEKTGFSAADLELLFRGLADMFNQHHSASAGLQTTRELYVFEHADKYGCYHASRLFDTIKENRNNEAAWVDEFPTKPQCFQITHDFSGMKNKSLPAGVTLWKWDFDDGKLVWVVKE